MQKCLSCNENLNFGEGCHSDVNVAGPDEISECPEAQG